MKCGGPNGFCISCCLWQKKRIKGAICYHELMELVEYYDKRFKDGRLNCLHMNLLEKYLKVKMVNDIFVV